MLRVHFTTSDLLQTRFATSPAPLLELTLALTAIKHRDGGPIFRSWQSRVRRRMPRAARRMFELIPPSGSSPCFLDPVVENLDAATETVRSTSTTWARAELRRVFPQEGPITPWIRALDQRDRSAWRELDVAQASAYVSVLEADWPRIEACHRTDLEVRSASLTTDGLQATLADLVPGAAWEDDTLVLPARRERDLHLDGRGLTLQSSAYWTDQPAITDHPDGSVVLIYPGVVSVPLSDPVRDQHALAELLGPTRAVALQCLLQQQSTTELASSVGISLAAASEQAKTLRQSGLITTQRAGKSVLHSCTPLGRRLIAGY